MKINPKNPGSLVGKTLQNVIPICELGSECDSMISDRMEHLIRPVRQGLKKIGVEVESS